MLKLKISNHKQGAIKYRRLLSLFMLLALLLLTPPSGNTISVTGSIPGTASGPTIRDLSNNLKNYPGGQVPRYEKLEITFQVNTLATNVQMPYDPAPPAGVQPGTGISVDGLFTPDNWHTTYTQPAFYYQDYLDQMKSGQEWFYPSGNFSWKLRFAPDRIGTWHFKLRAQDASGTTETPVQSFMVSDSVDKGPIRVSSRDSRYFEHADGTYFPALGYNLASNEMSSTNPVLGNKASFQEMSRDGIQLVRFWLSQWSIFGSAWSPWESIDPNLHGQYIPYTGLTFDQSYGSSDVSMAVDAGYNPCMFTAFLQPAPAVKPNTTYRVRIRYKTTGMAGAKTAGKPYGFVAKTGGWLWEDGGNCNDPGAGTAVTPYQPQNTTGWQILEGSMNSGNQNFLPYFYLVMDNTSQGKAYVDYVWIEEDLGNGRYGPNILPKPWMAQHQYFDQRNSYALDQLVSLAEQYGVYLRPVIQEKNDFLFNSIDFNGRPVAEDPRCYDADPANDPAECPGNQWFYGDGRKVSKVRWLQKAWWRYLQARWGYSANIQSWELLNEGDPWNSDHYALADEFARYMHQFKPDDHLVSTSFWNSFPRDAFWANPAYSAVDFADIHQYIPQSDPNFGDTAQATNILSMQYGARQSGGALKPVIRGETGLTVSGSEPPTDQLINDTQGIWLHKFIWAQINPGGLIESYWYTNDHIYQETNGIYQFDFRPQYRAYYNFIKDLPLSNGDYWDAAAGSSNKNILVWGQKDLAHGQAHLWIDNQQHTWQAVTNGASIPAQSGTVTLAGFKPEARYSLQWWDTYQADPARQVLRTDMLTAKSDGSLEFSVQNLRSDIAVRINIPPCDPADKTYCLFLPHMVSP